MSAKCFSTADKSTIFVNFPVSFCFSEHQYVSIKSKIYMDFNGSRGNVEYCAYNETTAQFQLTFLYLSPQIQTTARLKASKNTYL